MPQMTMLIKPASGSCNMRCRYCFYADEGKNRGCQSYGIMTEEMQETMIRKVFDYAEGSVSFAFQGGEPTLAGLAYFQRHMQLCKKYNRMGVRIANSLQTNGYAVDESWARFFQENNFLIGLSLDGPQEIHDVYRLDSSGEGTFQKVRQTSVLFQKYGVEFNILSVVSNLAAKNANRVCNFFLYNDFRFLQFIPCIDGFGMQGADFSLEPQLYAKFLILAFEKYYASFQKKKFVSMRTFDNYLQILMGYEPESCDMRGVCTAYFTIESDGSVYPCDFYALDRYKMGNLRENSFSELAGSGVIETFRKESLQIDAECRKCRWFRLCRGGCRRQREPISGEGLARNKYCQSYRLFFEKCYPKLLEMAKSLQRR